MKIIFFLLKAGNVKTKYIFLDIFKIREIYLTPCYEENSNTIYEEISKLIKKYQLNFNEAFYKKFIFNV